ncbi:MAG TPA: hypothetical protein VKC90_04190 [Chitinophagaceae bacterium]|nr:hypothetical protein [Chitinophagaceae bacterium]
MRKFFIQLALQCIVLSAISQKKIAALNVDKNFQIEDYAKAYYNKYKNSFGIVLQNGNNFTRLMYDGNFNLTDSFSFNANTITFNYNQSNRLKFLTNISLEGENYEAYADREKIVFINPDFKDKIDKIIYEHIMAQTEKDETLLAVFPGRNEIRILSASFRKNKLFLYTWKPDRNIIKASLDLPESNITDEQQKKEIPKIARINFSRYLTNLTVQPIKQTSLLGSRNASLHYSDSIAYIKIATPYNLGVYIMELNLITNQLKGINFFINSLKDNASDNAYQHKNVTSLIYDTLLILKNASDKIFEYYFYDIRTGKQLKKYSSSSNNLNALIHSDLKQKGTWGSANEEKEFDNYKQYLRKGGRGIIVAATVSTDSLTITNLFLQPTSGVAGTLLDFLVPLPLDFAGMPMYITSFMPPLGKFRDKIIYAHSRFSIKDLLPSNSTSVTTALDYLLTDKNSENISLNSSFFINNNESYYLGYYSKDSKKIEIYRYDVVQ